MPAGMRMVTMDTTTDWNALNVAKKRQRTGAMAAYGGMATAMDREIGRLVAHLKATGDYDDTIFVFLSDNGGEAIDPMHSGGLTRLNADYYYDQRVERQGRRGSLTAIGTSFASAVSAPLRGYKFTASEGGLRVPLIIAWPGQSRDRIGQRPRTGFAYVTDIAPTLLTLAGVAPQHGRFAGRSVEPMAGYSLVPQLEGMPASVHPATLPLGYELAGNAVVFEGDWKLVKNLPPYGDGRWALYDITRDPGEVTDRSRAEPARFAAMQAAYATYARRDRVLPMPPGYRAPRQVQQKRAPRPAHPPIAPAMAVRCGSRSCRCRPARVAGAPPVAPGLTLPGYRRDNPLCFIRHTSWSNRSCPKKGFAIEHHQRHAVVTAGPLCLLIGLDRGVEPLRLGADPCIERRQVEPGARRRVGEVGAPRASYRPIRSR